ncbi:unnamed protein product [Scytosiphon promiscuus]
MFSSKTPAGTGGGDSGRGNQRKGWMSGVFAMVRDKTLSPRVVQPSRGSRNKSWSSSTGVITDLTHFERVSLNAAEERVLPPEIRIKIVFAQANAGEQEEEMLEADVKRLDGLVRTIALYGILERNMMDPPKADKLTPDREAYLGKMLVAAVQLELFQMLDDICEAGDVENELFDDLCSDTIQDGRRTGFIMMTADLLLSPGSGYKRLLQIRKDQILEEIADVAGLRKLGGHDCQRDSSESPKTWSPRYRRRKEMDSDCGSPDPGSAGAAAGLRISPNGVDSRNTAAYLSDDLSPSPSSQRPDSRSPSPEAGHRRSQTQRVRDLLSSIDGLVMESEQPEDEADDALANLTASPRGRSVRGYKRQSTGARLDSLAGGSGTGGASRSARLSLHTPPRGDDDEGGEGGRQGDDGRAFFSTGRGWRAGPFAGTPPSELAKRRASVIPAPGADEADDPASADMLLAEVDWLIAGTNAALGVSEKGEDDDNSGGGSGVDPIGQDGLEITPDKREELSPTREDVAESSAATRVAQEGGGRGDVDAEADPIGKDGLEITPDKRELSPLKRADNDGDVSESADASRVAARDGEESEGEDVQQDEDGVSPVCAGKQEAVGGSDAGSGEAADAQQAELPSPSPERALTASPSPETRVSGSSPSTVPQEEEGIRSNGVAVSDDGRGDGGDATVDVRGDAAEDALGSGEKEQGNGRPVIGDVAEAARPGLEDESAPVAAASAATEGAPVAEDGDEIEDALEGAPKGQEPQQGGPAVAAEDAQGQNEERNGRPGEGVGGAAEDETERPPGDATSEPEGEPVVAAAGVPLEVGEAEREGQGEEGEEESGKVTGDAVVESGVAGGVAPEGEENGGVVLYGPGRNEGHGGREQGSGGASGPGAARPVPGSTEEDGKQEEAAGDNGSGDDALSLKRSKGSTGVSDMDGPPAAELTLEAVASDPSGASEVSGPANEGGPVSPEDVAPVAFHGYSRRVPANGLGKDALGGLKEEESASAVAKDAAEAPVLEDVEL